jgi:hypothetical protein
MAHQTLGGVPPLVFIKDKQYAAMSEVIGISYSLEHKQYSTFYDKLC